MNAPNHIVAGNAHIERARRRIAEVGTWSLLSQCLDHLRRAPSRGFDWYARCPYLALLIMKWAAELWREGEGRRASEDADFAFILQAIWDAGGQLLQQQVPSIMLRRLAFQQVWYQTPFDIGGIPRQALLFCELMANTPPVRAFAEERGPEPRHFMRQLTQMTFQMGEICGLPELRIFHAAPGADDAHHRSLFVPHVIFDLPAMHRRAQELAAYGTPREVELCEQTFLIRSPFLETERGAECVHPHVFFQTAATLFYDVLRERDANQFMRYFGPAFQVYVEQVLAELPYRLICEDELGAMLVGQGKCVDFAVVSDEALLLLDSKGIEGHYNERYHNLSEVLTPLLKTSALHAADQAVETVRRLPDELRKPLTVFLCVSYKQLNVGSGTALRDLTQGTAEWDAPRWNEPALPPENIFTVSIAELEHLCAVLRSGVPLADVLRRVLACNEVAESKALLLGQHLAGYGVSAVPECARAAINRVCQTP